MSAPRYIYQRTGGPLVRWDRTNGRPPGQARGADAKSLGGIVEQVEHLVGVKGASGKVVYARGMRGFGSLGSADPSDDLASATVSSMAPVHAVRTNRRPLPQPGAPEYLGMGGGCGCSSCEDSEPIRIDIMPAIYVGLGYFLAKWLGRTSP